MRREVDVLVVGAGVVGLATAATLAKRGGRVVVLERHAGIARETSSHNSEVIHAGIYYPPGSAKARHCTRGRELVYERCARLRIPHRRVGKWIVAVEPSEVSALEELLARGRTNGVPGLEVVDGAEVARAEPAVRGVAALCSPETGILDSHAFCVSFAAEFEAAGGEIVLRAGLEGIDRLGGGFRAAVREPDGSLTRVSCGALVNAAGLGAERVAAMAGLDTERAGLRLHPCKGDYFALSPGSPLRLSSLVYPVPGGPGLGIHATPDLAGRIRFGPDAEYVAAPRYDVDAGKACDFADSLRRFLPALESSWLVPDSAGVRPKLAGPGEDFRDFVVREESEAGLPGFVNLVGIESPGLTAAPAIAERVAEMLG